MNTDYISTSTLQRKANEAFNTGPDIKIVLKNETIQGMVFSKDATELLLKSGLLTEIKEELWELQDKDTVDMLKSFHKGDNADSIDFNDFRKEYGL